KPLNGRCKPEAGSLLQFMVVEHNSIHCQHRRDDTASTYGDPKRDQNKHPRLAPPQEECANCTGKNRDGNRYAGDVTRKGVDHVALPNEFKPRDSGAVRRSAWLADSGSLLGVLSEERNRVSHCLHCLRALVRNLDVELLLKSHHQLDSVEAVCTELLPRARELDAIR